MLVASGWWLERPVGAVGIGIGIGTGIGTGIGIGESRRTLVILSRAKDLGKNRK